MDPGGVKGAGSVDERECPLSNARAYLYATEERALCIGSGVLVSGTTRSLLLAYRTTHTLFTRVHMACLQKRLHPRPLIGCLPASPVARIDQTCREQEGDLSLTGL